MTAQIVIDPGGDPVVGSRIMASTFAGTAFTFSNDDDAGVLGWKWEWLDTPFVSGTLEPKPAPSFASTLIVTPDVMGWSILIRLTTYRDVARTIVDGVDTQELSIKFPAPFDWYIPAAGETREQNQARGWSRMVNRILADINANLGSGGGVRDPQFWAVSSNDDGTYSGSPDNPHIGEAFPSDPDRINLYVLDCTTDLPAFGAGDHNRIVTYKEPNSGAASSLVVTAQGATQINYGRYLGRTSVTLHGQGAKHVFRYDETIDKFVVVEGAQALSSKELRSTADYIESAGDTAEIADLPAATNNDVTATGISAARYVFIAAASGGPFASITGLDASAVEDTEFEHTKYLVNISGQPVTITFNDGGSSSPNQFSGIGAGPFVLPNMCLLKIQYFGDTSRWFVHLPDRGDGVSLMRGAQIANVTAYDNELLRADASGGNFAVTAPSATPYPGETFAVTRPNPTGVITVSGDGQNIQDPTTFLFGATATMPTTAGAGPVVRWYWDEVFVAWAVIT